jgi:hypothetical protein
MSVAVLLEGKRIITLPAGQASTALKRGPKSKGEAATTLPWRLRARRQERRESIAENDKRFG